MRRRHYLKVASAACVLSVTAGCTGVMKEIPGRSDGGGERIAPDGPEEPNDDGEPTVEEVWYYLENADTALELTVAPEVHGVVLENDSLKVRIELQGGTRSVRAEQITATAALYAQYVDYQDGPRRLEGTIVNAFDEERQTFYCEQSWAEAYLAEEVTPNEFGARVLETLESS